MMLADFGAEVIKIEKPVTGDTLRAWPPINAGFSENFASLNRNKKSIALDLKDAAERALARDLALAADVVIENYRPGVMARNGLDFRTLSKIKPSLVYCSISAFGQTGPRSGEGGFDLTIQAAAGVMSVTGTPGEAPVKCGVPIADFAAGAYGAFAVSAALRKAAQTGQGEHIDVSMLGVTLGFAALQTSEYFGTGEDPQKLGSAHPRNAPYQAFRAKDGYFVMAAGNDRLWSSVCRVVERPEWVEDARFITTSERTKNQVELCALLEAIFSSSDAAHWVETFTRRQRALRADQHLFADFERPAGRAHGLGAGLGASQRRRNQDFHLPRSAVGQDYRAPFAAAETRTAPRRNYLLASWRRRKRASRRRGITRGENGCRIDAVSQLCRRRDQGRVRRDQRTGRRRSRTRVAGRPGGP